MILLWRDPDGTTVSTVSTKSQPFASNNKDVQKISTLEQKISERDNTIALLKDEIKRVHTGKLKHH